MDAMRQKLERLCKTALSGESGDYAANIEKMFNRAGLDLRKRLLCAISTVTSMGHSRHLRFFIEWALSEGVHLTEIREVILQCYLFAGYPVAIEGFFVFRDVLERRSISLESSEGEERTDTWRERGLGLCKQVYGKNFNSLRENMKELSPELAEWMVVEGYGKVLSRPQLGAVERELCTVAVLTAMGKGRQLLSHIKGARNVGATATEVKEAILQTSLFIGYPAVLEALDVFRRC